MCAQHDLCGDHHRFVVVFLGIYFSCWDPLAIIYRAVLIFSRLTVEICNPLRLRAPRVITSSPGLQ